MNLRPASRAISNDCLRESAKGGRGDLDVRFQNCFEIASLRLQRHQTKVTAQQAGGIMQVKQFRNNVKQAKRKYQLIDQNKMFLL